jgi:hypothetical protein
LQSIKNKDTQTGTDLYKNVWRTIMDWIKKILDKHKKEDGKVDIEAAMTEINTEFPKNVVPKDKFNDVSGQLKTANSTIEDLKKNNSSNEDLQKKIKEHEDTIANLQAEAVKKEKETLVKSALEKAGATDPDYVIFKNGGIDKYELQKDGTIKDLDSLIKLSKENNPTFFKAEDLNKKDDKTIIENKLPGGTPPAGDDISILFANALNQF